MMADMKKMRNIKPGLEILDVKLGQEVLLSLSQPEAVEDAEKKEDILLHVCGQHDKKGKNKRIACWKRLTE